LVTSLLEIGRAIALNYAHYFVDVMIATLLWAMVERAWERIAARKDAPEGRSECWVETDHRVVGRRDTIG
jgi:uncharacterized membrane protein